MYECVNHCNDSIIHQFIYLCLESSNCMEKLITTNLLRGASDQCFNESIDHLAWGIADEQKPFFSMVS